jgi:two-component system, NtrC family, sensor kinase
VFIVSLLWQDTSLLTYSSRNSIIRVVFIWLVILMSWFIVEIINRQKEEIMRARENLIRSENLAILGELAAGVAHEINNPIGIISAYAEYLKKNAPPDDPRSEDFDVIQKEAQRCEHIVAEMLNYARPAGHAKAPSDLRTVNDEVLDFLFRRPTAEEIRIHKDYPEHLPLLSLDVNQMKQALLNIYLNARQAMAETGGALRIRIWADLDHNIVRQRVEDNGSGIDADALAKAFDPFFTTRAKGTGLGLAITKRIIEAHGGRIGIDSVKGKGTAIEILLPYDQTLTV